MNPYVQTATSFDAREFLGGYLAKEDINEELTATLTDVRPEEVPGSTRRKLTASFAEFEKPLILNATNIKRLSKMFKSTDTASWRGPVTLYVDPSVEYAGRIIGGIRLRPVAQNAPTSAQVFDVDFS